MACDFLVSVTVTFRLLFVFVVIEHSTRRLVHFNVARHPTAEWTLQQLREVIGFGGVYRYLLHDRDSIFAQSLDASIKRLGLAVLRSRPHSPMANAICERLIGTIRRECLDWLIPLSESHLRIILKEWVRHYNEGRPHMSLGPGVPDPLWRVSAAHISCDGHHLTHPVLAREVLGGLHHEYGLALSGTLGSTMAVT